MPFTIHGKIVRGARPEEPGLPSMREQLRNARAAALRLAKAIVKGETIWRTPAQREEWREICRSNRCGFFREKDGATRCAHPKCGCFLKVKRMLATEQCPAGLFGDGK